MAHWYILPTERNDIMPVVTGNPPPQPPKTEPPTPAQPPPSVLDGSILSAMTQEQFLAIVRWLLATAGPLLIAKGYVSDELWAQLAGVAISLAPLIWSLITKTRSGLIKSAASLPEVKQIVAAPAIANGTLRADPKVVSH